ncbi:MAG: PAS domain S-box protein [Pyrinomonadaceae bacterium]|nr:PAS domain S-box protein [Pyrinomonadaceae bacterium]
MSERSSKRTGLVLPNQKAKFWRTAAQCLAGTIAVALITFVCVRLRLNLATAVCLYLVVVILVSLQGNFLSSAIVSLLASGCFLYFLSPPTFSFWVSDLSELVVIVVFLTISALTTYFVSRVSKATEELREQASLLNLTHDSIFVRDMNNVITYWNHGAEELYGWTVGEAIGKTTHQLLGTAFPAPLDEINNELLRTGRWEGELRHTKADGTHVVVASRWSLQRDERQGPLAILELNGDITERKRAEDAIRRQANLLEQTHDAIIVWELPQKIIFWNRAAEQLYGFSKEEAIGRPNHELLQTEHPMPTPVFEGNLERDGEWAGELTHTARDGRKIVVESRHVMVPEADGRRLVLETNRDITERKQTQESLDQAQANLARVNRVMLVGEMTASIAHEVNQPIAAAVTNAGACLRWLAAQPPDMEKARLALDRIVRDGSRASEVIRRVRALVKKVPPRADLFDINDAVLEVIAMAQSELQKLPVDLRTRLSSDVPLVTADRVQLQQVILNLIVNAIDAMSGVGDGSRELVVGSGRSDPDDVFVEVRDSGPGLDPASLNRLFDSFYSTKPDGMGMGLSISRSIVEAHGGRLWAMPNEPHGAVFRFTLPVEGGGNL